MSEVQCRHVVSTSYKLLMYDSVSLVSCVFQLIISSQVALNNGKVDEQKFTMLQTFHLGVLNELANLDCKMEVVMRTQLQKSLLEEISNLMKAVRGAS